MVKNIVGQVLYQFAVMLCFLFAGTSFLIEYNEKIENPDKPGFVMEATEFDEALYGKSRHYTYLFNCFVWLQVFNIINARKIKDEINIFTGILKSSLFIVILMIIVIFQVSPSNLL